MIAPSSARLRRLLVAALAAALMGAPVGSSASVPEPGCALRGPIPAQDDWCEAWVRSPTFLPVAMDITADGARTVAAGLDLITAAITVGVVDNATGDFERTFRAHPDVSGLRAVAFPRMVLDDERGIVYLTGLVQGRVETTEGFQSFNRIWTAAYGLDGTRLWQSVHEGSVDPRSAESPTDLALSADGSTIAVVGGSHDGAVTRLLTLSIDAATGRANWSALFGGADRWWGGHVTVSSTGDRIYAVGLRGQGIVDVLAYTGRGSAAGELHWQYESTSPRFLYARGGIKTAPGGGLVLLAGYDLAADTLRPAVLALDGEGSVEWLASIEPLMPQVRIAANLDEPSAEVALVQTPTQGVPLHLALDGDSVVLAGFQLEWDAQYGILTPAPALALLAVNLNLADGSVRWQRTYRAPSDRIFYPTGLHAEGGNALVTGIASDCNFFFRPPYPCTTEVSYVPSTLAFDLGSGSLEHVARYNQTPGVPSGFQPSPYLGVSHDLVSGSGAGPDGTVAVGVWSKLGSCSSCETGHVPVVLGYRS